LVVVMRNGSFEQVRFASLAVLAALLGVAVLTVPFWLRLARDLSEGRKARIRTDERAAIAAHLHDSVLQTLALIQKRADSSREVAWLARRQERELRSWLYGANGYRSGGGSGGPADAASSEEDSETPDDSFSSAAPSDDAGRRNEILSTSLASACA